MVRVLRRLLFLCFSYPEFSLITTGIPATIHTLHRYRSQILIQPAGMVSECTALSIPGDNSLPRFIGHDDNIARASRRTLRNVFTSAYGSDWIPRWNNRFPATL